MAVISQVARHERPIGQTAFKNKKASPNGIMFNNHQRKNHPRRASTEKSFQYTFNKWTALVLAVATRNPIL